MSERNGKSFTDAWAKPAHGQPFHHHIKAAVAFDPETFKQIRDRALANHTSFAEQVRQLVEWGLEDSESGREP